MNNYCLYHVDEIVSAFIVSMKYGNSFRYISLELGELVPWRIINDNKIDKIFIIGLKFSKHILKELDKHCLGLIVVDSIIWNYLFPGEEMPFSIELLKKYSLKIDIASGGCRVRNHIMKRWKETGDLGGVIDEVIKMNGVNVQGLLEIKKEYSNE